jgi:hypothetical protein
MRIDPMHIADITLRLDEPWHVRLHVGLTVLSGLSAARREWFVDTITAACAGIDLASTVTWVDDTGHRHVVAPSDRIVPGVIVLGEELGHPTCAQLADWLNRSHRQRRGAPTLVVLNEPFTWCTDDETWDRMEVLERASRAVQVLVCSDDPCVLAWAEHRTPAGSVVLIESAALEP